MTVTGHQLRARVTKPTNKRLRVLRESDYYTLSVALEWRVVSLVRTSTAFVSLSALEHENAGIVEAMTSFRGSGLVIDMRAATPNNDPTFESTMRDFRMAVGKLFPRVVLLVASVSGEMQVKRLHRTDQLPYLVTRDPDQAWQLAGGP